MEAVITTFLISIADARGVDDADYSFPRLRAHMMIAADAAAYLLIRDISAFSTYAGSLSLLVGNGQKGRSLPRLGTEHIKSRTPICHASHDARHAEYCLMLRRASMWPARFDTRSISAGKAWKYSRMGRR